MKRYNQFNKLVVSDFETAVWEHPAHKHNHFEIIFIVHGSGIHRLNHRSFQYKKGHLYLLGPEDEHEFIVQEKTRFIYFKFTGFYLNTTDVDDPSQWNMDVDLILKSKQRRQGNILKLENDVELVKNILFLVTEEYQKNEFLNQKIIFQFFKALVLIIKRNLHQQPGTRIRQSSGKVIENILEYIELNIYDPQQLMQKTIAENFHFSPNYIGIYFKEKVGTPMKQYIQEYRYNLLKQRISNGQMSTKQLVIDFGFTDESHLNKFLKKQSGDKLSEIR